MVCDLEAATFQDQAVWRMGHAPTPWRFTDWAHADHHGRFDGRWDDPAGSYRVLYASTSRFGAFVEALGDFRADPEVLAGLKDIVTDNEEHVVPPGHLPVSWLRGRVAGEATATARCAQVGHSRSLACLRRELAGLYVIAEESPATLTLRFSGGTPAVTSALEPVDAVVAWGTTEGVSSSPGGGTRTSTYTFTVEETGHYLGMGWAGYTDSLPPMSESTHVTADGFCSYFGPIDVNAPRLSDRRPATVLHRRCG